jgi:carbonic anhydrase/SulP family sulfate permease
MAVIFSCMDSRTPAELVFDLGIGDIFSVRIAGNVARAKVLASLEYSCAVAGAKLIVVMGHTSCGAVHATVDHLREGRTAKETTDCDHLDDLVREIGRSVEPEEREMTRDPEAQAAFVDLVSRRNVLRVMRQIPHESPALRKMVADGSVAIVGGIYDVSNSNVAFFDAHGNALLPGPTATPVTSR